MIRIACPKCKERLELDDDTGGQVGQCPDCGTRFQIPACKGKPKQRPRGTAPAARKEPPPMPQPAESGDSTADTKQDSECYQIRQDDEAVEGRMPGRTSTPVVPLKGAIGYIRLSNDGAPVNCVAYSPDHCYALAGLYRRVYVLDARNGKRVYKLKHHAEEISSLAFSADGKLGLAGDAAGNLLLWEVASARLLRWLDGHRAAIEAIAFSPSGGYAVSGDGDGLLSLWDVSVGQAIQRFGQRGRQVTSLAFSPEGRYVFYATSSGGLRVWDVVSAQQVASLRCDGIVTAVAFGGETRDRRLVAVGLTRNAVGKQLAAWEWEFPRLTPLECLTNGSNSEANVSCVTVTADGMRAITAGEISFERSKNAGWLIRWPMRYDVMLAMDVAELAAGRNRRCIEIWNIVSGRVSHTMEGSEHKVTCLAVSADGCRMISGDKDGGVMIWGLPG